VEAVDARVVAFQVGPEQTAQEVRQRLQAGVVQRGLPFTQVLHQKVPDRAAGQVVAVDHLLGSPLTGGAQLAQRRWRVVTEHAHGMQGSIEQVGGADRGAACLGLQVEELQHIAGGDVSQSSALAGQYQCAAVGGAGRGRRRHVWIGRTQRPQLGEALDVAAPCHDIDQRPLAEGGSDQPAKRRPDQVSADAGQQATEEAVVHPGGGVSMFVQPADRDVSPPPSVDLDPAGLPPLLPGLPRLVGQPVQHQADPEAEGVRVTAASTTRRERRPRQLADNDVTVLSCRRPVRLDRPSRWVKPDRLSCAGRRLSDDASLVDAGRGHRVPPNNTCSVSGRYPGADGGVRSTAFWVCCAWWARIRRITSCLRGFR